MIRKIYQEIGELMSLLPGLLCILLAAVFALETISAVWQMLIATTLGDAILALVWAVISWKLRGVFWRKLKGPKPA